MSACYPKNTMICLDKVISPEDLLDYLSAIETLAQEVGEDSKIFIVCDEPHGVTGFRTITPAGALLKIFQSKLWGTPADSINNLKNHIHERCDNILTEEQLTEYDGPYRGYPMTFNEQVAMIIDIWDKIDVRWICELNIID